MAQSPSSSLDAVVGAFGLRPASPGDRSGRFGVVRAGGRARFLVPLASRRAAAASCLAYNRLRDRRTRAQRAVLGGALAVGPGRVLTPEQLVLDGTDTVLDHVQRELGRDDLCFAIGLGTLDTVWKPTLQVMSLDGTPVAYVKCGWTPFTTGLVRNEAAALAAVGVAAPAGLHAPRLLGESTWRDLTLVAVAPLPRDVRRIADDAAVPSPAPVRTIDGPSVTATLGDAAWWRELSSSVRSGSGGEHDAELAAAVDAVEAAFGSAETGLARWHGDWTPWNLAQSPSVGLVAWDWEYSAPGAPVGLDELHSAFQVRRLLQGHPAARAFEGSAGDAAALLAAVHPVMAAERVLRDVRAGCALDAGGEETLATAAAASVAATRR